MPCAPEKEKLQSFLKQDIVNCYRVLVQPGNQLKTVRVITSNMDSRLAIRVASKFVHKSKKDVGRSSALIAFNNIKLANQI